MKIFFCLLSLFLLTSIVSPAQKTVPGEYNAKVVYIGTPQEGEITVSCTGIGKKQFESLNDAEAAAFYTLMFRGIPGSQYELPMIANESKKDDPVIVKLLKGGYHSFLVETTLTKEGTEKERVYKKKGKVSSYTITINCVALRKYLEQNGVIRKFGI